MPFDSTPTKLPLTRTQKLERLLYHLSVATDREQLSFCSCLLRRCAFDPILVSDGLPEADLMKLSFADWYKYFEIGPDETCYKRLFGTAPVATKTAMVMSLLL